MRKKGFEPSQALSHWSLNPARLTTPALPHQIMLIFDYKKFYKLKVFSKIEDGHSRLETPVPFPNTEVKLPMLMVVVSYKMPNLQAVFHILFIVLILVCSMNKISKTEAKTQIQEFFSHAKNKNPREVKKIKKLAMKKSIPLKKLRKKFCQKCLTPYKNPKIRIRNKKRVITCENCGHVSRWKLE